MFDQAGMVRELVKWDYELRDPAQAGAVVARAVEAAMAPPRGPVYLMLPREPLSAPAGTDKATEPRSLPSATHPDPASMARLADWLIEAERPLLIASSVGRVPEEAQALARLAERFGLPVVAHTPRYVCLASDHPMHHGFDPGPFLDDADVIVAIKSDVPWMPSIKAPGPSARIAHIGEDPAFLRYPCGVSQAIFRLRPMPALHCGRWRERWKSARRSSRRAWRGAGRGHMSALPRIAQRRRRESRPTARTSRPNT